MKHGGQREPRQRTLSFSFSFSLPGLGWRVRHPFLTAYATLFAFKGGADATLKGELHFTLEAITHAIAIGIARTLSATTAVGQTGFHQLVQTTLHIARMNTEMIGQRIHCWPTSQSSLTPSRQWRLPD
jgi:hypothetical protein